MKGRIVSTLLAFCMVLALLPGTAWAAEKSGYCGAKGGKNLTWKLDSGGVLTISGSGNMGLKSYPDNTYGYDYYNYSDKITSVVLQNGVNSIGPRAFSNCSNLLRVTISDTVTSIGAGAFEGCSKLSHITIPDSVTEIVGSAFENCTSLRSVTLPKELSSLNRGLFYGCSNLESVTLPNSLLAIQGHAFYGCSSLKSLTLPDSLLGIGMYAFYGCSSLESLTLPSSLLELGEYMFYGCSSLTSIELPNSVVGWLGTEMFKDCTNLASVTIPNTVSHMGKNIFSNCSRLTDIYYTGSQQEWNNIDIDTTNNDELSKVTIHYNSTGSTGGGSNNPEIYTVTFNANGGMVDTEEKEYKAGDTFGALPTPTYSGYKFDGWYTAKTGGTKVSSSTKVTTDMTLYAYWTPEVIYSVSFDTNYIRSDFDSDSDLIPIVPPIDFLMRRYMSNATLGTLPTPIRTGYKFSGWYTAKTGGTKVTTSTKVTSNMTLYAHWTKNTTTKTYTIKLDANSGKVSPSSIKVESGKTYYSSLPTPTRAGYKFDGWYTTRTGGTKITSTAKATANRTLYAHWSRAKMLLVTFDGSGGMVDEDQKTVRTGRLYGELPTPTKNNAHFQGWYTKKTGGTKVTETTRVSLTDGHTLYARWGSSATVRSTQRGTYRVTIPAYYELALYASSSTAKISSQVETSAYQTVTCTQKATLSNGTVRYYGKVNGKTGWFTYSCEMDIK